MLQLSDVLEIIPKLPRKMEALIRNSEDGCSVDFEFNRSGCYALKFSIYDGIDSDCRANDYTTVNHSYYKHNEYGFWAYMGGGGDFKDDGKFTSVEDFVALVEKLIKFADDDYQKGKEK